MKLYLIKLWSHTISRLNCLPILCHTHKVKNIVIKCVEEYLIKENISYQKIITSKIKQGHSSRACDAGSFLINIYFNNGQTMQLFAKRNSFLGRINIAKGQFINKDYSHKPDHNINLHNFAFISGLDVIKPLYINNEKRVIITESTDGLPLKQALKKDSEKTLELIKKVGAKLAKYHQLNIIYKRLKPEHIYLNFDTNKITFIDCDRLEITNSEEKFVKDFYYLYCRFYFNYPKKTATQMQNNLLIGYFNSIEKNNTKLLNTIKNELTNSKYNCFFKKQQHLINKFIDQKIINKLSFGYFKWIP